MLTQDITYTVGAGLKSETYTWLQGSTLSQVRAARYGRGHRLSRRQLGIVPHRGMGNGSGSRRGCGAGALLLSAGLIQLLKQVTSIGTAQAPRNPGWGGVGWVTTAVTELGKGRVGF